VNHDSTRIESAAVFRRFVGDGISFQICHGVVVENCHSHDNSDFGVYPGSGSQRPLIRNNDINNSGKIGILFRDDTRGQDFWANRNVVENNRIINSGGDAGIAIDINGRTKDTRIVKNEIRETRQPMQRTAIRIAADAGRVELAANVIEGFAENVVDQRTNS
jgi:hypothetical protein